MEKVVVYIHETFTNVSQMYHILTTEDVRINSDKKSDKPTSLNFFTMTIREEEKPSESQCSIREYNPVQFRVAVFGDPHSARDWTPPPAETKKPCR